METQFVAVGADDDGGTQGMFAAAFRGARQVQQRADRDAFHRDHGVHAWAAQGQRPGLVEDDRIDAMGDLECLPAADEDAALGAPAGPNHDRGGRGQTHGARTGDHEHRDRRHQAMRQARFGPHRQPGQQGQGRHEEHDRHEHLGDAVGQPRDGRLRPLRTLDEGHDPGERGIAPDARRTHHEGPGRIHRRADDLVAGTLDGRQRFAGEERLVDRGGSFDQHAVDRDLVARPDPQQVADRDEVERDLGLLVAHHAPRRRGAERREPPDRPGGSRLGPLLEVAAQQDEPDDQRGTHR